MQDKRLELLKNYLSTIFKTKFLLKKINDDASFRRYFRITFDKKSYIVMDAPPEKEKLDNFIKIANFFKKGNINTPKIYFQNKKIGCLVLEDFGNITLFNELLTKSNNLDLYKLAIDELIKIGQLPNDNLRLYDTTILLAELNLSQQWFKNNFDYNHIFKFLLNHIKNHAQVVVHRDYHSRNIMLVNNKLGIIDFQDSVIGSYVYDIASLLKDVYIELNDGELQILLKYYFSKLKLDNFEQFIFDFDIISVQRHLKILGIFKRLSVRDGKNQYLENIPLAKKYLINMAHKYHQLSTLKQLCKP